MFERLVDAKGTFEGKALSVLLSVALVLSVTNVFAFAEAGGVVSEDAKTGQIDPAVSADQRKDAAVSESAASGGAKEPAGEQGAVPAASSTAAVANDPHAVLPTPPLVEANLDEAVVTFDLENAYVEVRGQKLAGTKKIPMKIEKSKDLTFRAGANAGYKIASIKAKNSATENVPVTVKDGMSAIAADHVNSTLVVVVKVEADEAAEAAPTSDTTPLTNDTDIKAEGGTGESAAAGEPAAAGESEAGEAADSAESAESEAAEGSESADHEAADGKAAADDEEVVTVHADVSSPVFEGYAYVGNIIVKVTAGEGVLPEGTTVKAVAVESQDVIDAVSDKVEAQGKELQDAVAIDVTLLDKDGDTIQPDGAVNVCFFDNYVAGDEIGVYRVSNDTSTVETIGARQANPTIQSFDVDHFTIYVVGGTTENSNVDGAVNSIDHQYAAAAGETVELRVSDLDPSRVGSWAIAQGDDAYGPNETEDGTSLDWGYDLNEGQTPKDAYATVAISEGAEPGTTYAVRYGSDGDNFEYFYISVVPTVKFDANGASGTAPDSISEPAGTVVILPGAEGLTMGEGEKACTFMGWADYSDVETTGSGGGEIYPAGSKWTVEGNKTFFAVWQESSAKSIRVGAESSTTIEENGTVQLVAMRTPVDAPVTWSSSDASVATVDGSGLVSAVHDGTATITAALDGETSSSIVITVATFRSVAFDNNGGSASAPASTRKPIGTTISLPDYSGERKDLEFVGWSTDSNATGGGVAHYTNTVYPVGYNYTVSSEDVILYATWASKNLDAEFCIRTDGKIPREPQAYPTDQYTGRVKVEDAVKLGVFYANTTGVSAKLAYEPTPEQIRDHMVKTYDPNTQDVVWYVIKNESDGWHVDGVIVDKNKVALTYEPNAPDGIWDNMPAGEMYNKNDQATISDMVPTRSDGYVFDGWKESKEGAGYTTYWAGNEIVMDSDKTLYAQWKSDDHYTVTYKTDPERGGSLSQRSQTDLVDSNEKVAGSTVTPNPGYKFKGWYKGAHLVSSDLTLSEGTAKDKLNVDKNGHYANTTYTAKFEVDQTVKFNYEVNYFIDETTKPVPGIDPNPKTGTGYVGEWVTWENPATSGGYKLKEWQPTGLTVTNDNKASATVYYAVDPSQTYDVTYKAETGGQVARLAADGTKPVYGLRWTNDDIWVREATGVTGAIVKTDNGYTFDGWYVGEGDAAKKISSNEVLTREEAVKHLNAGKTTGSYDNTLYTARWTQDEYAVTYTDGVEGSEVFADQVTGGLAYGDETPAFTNGGDTPADPARPGYTFKGWSPEVAGTVTGSVTYTAQWTQDVYAVTYTDGVEGSEVFADQVTGGLAYGDETPAFTNGGDTPADPARPGYTFKGWSPEVAGTVTGSVTYTAQWTANPSARYEVQYYRQNVVGDGYALFETTEGVGTTGTEVTAAPKSYTGFTHVVTGDSVESGIIAGDGSLVLRLYYDRNLYTVSGVIDNGGSVEGNNQEVRYLASSEPMTFTAASGYRIVSIAVNGEPQNVTPGMISYTFGAVSDVDRNYVVDVKTAALGSVVAIAPSARKTYDGTPLVPGAAVFEGLPAGYTAEAVVSGEQTNAGSSMSSLSNIIIRDADGNDVTRDFAIDAKDGTLIVDPASVVITVNSASKQVGTTDPVFTGKPDGLVSQDDLGTITYYRIGSEEAVGSYPDVLVASYASNPNYTAEVTPGTFTITAAPVPDEPTPDTPGGTTPGGTTPGGTTPDTPGGTTPTPGGTTPGNIIPVIPTPPTPTQVPGTVPDGALTPAMTPLVDALEGAAEAVIGEDATPLADIGDEATPLAERHVSCWVHFYIILGIIVTLVYAACVAARRALFSRRLKKYEDEIAGDDNSPSKEPAREGFGFSPVPMAPRGATATAFAGQNK